jgi:hypothetical protein
MDIAKRQMDTHRYRDDNDLGSRPNKQPKNRGTHFPLDPKHGLLLLSRNNYKSANYTYVPYYLAYTGRGW